MRAPNATERQRRHQMIRRIVPPKGPIETENEAVESLCIQVQSTTAGRMMFHQISLGVNIHINLSPSPYKNRPSEFSPGKNRAPPLAASASP